MMQRLSEDSIADEPLSIEKYPT